MTALPPSLHRSSLHPARSHSTSGSFRRDRFMETSIADDDVQPPAGLAMLLAAIVGAALITGVLVGAVWVRMAKVQAGYAIHALQRETVKLRQHRSELQVEVAALKRHDRLADVATKRLDLVTPRPENVKRLSALKAAKAAPPKGEQP